MLLIKPLKSLNVIGGGGGGLKLLMKIWPKKLFNIPHEDPLKLHFIMHYL